MSEGTDTDRETKERKETREEVGGRLKIAALLPLFYSRAHQYARCPFPEPAASSTVILLDDLFAY